MFLHVIRAIFLLCLIGIALSYVTSEPSVVGLDESSKLFAYHREAVILGTVGLGILIIGIDLLISRKSLSAISGLFLGLIVGLVMAFVFSMVIDLVVESVAPQLKEPVLGTVLQHVGNKTVSQTIIVGYRDKPVVSALKLLIGVISCYLAISFVLQTKEDFRFIIPYIEFDRQTRGGKPILLDTSAIIDGRILGIIRTNMIDNPILIPRFVLHELQNIADSGDKLRRSRGRRGLDIVNKLIEEGADVRIYEDKEDTFKGDVDHRLVELAEKIQAKIMTTDYNLNKVATIKKVDVININELANAFKPQAIPGEKLCVKIVKAGEEPNQGVGYLEDGTMVVVEDGRGKIGQMVEVSVTSTIQTSAGKMIFGRLKQVVGGEGKEQT